jgi:ElaB/YqjD/DUF883 family membrane-anchored ribosome-binding protein
MMNQSVADDRMAASPMDRMTQGAHQTVDRLAERAAPAMDRMQQAAERAGDMMGEKFDEFSTMQEEWMESMREQVRTRPLAVLGVAVLAGLVLGRMMR